MNLLRLFQWLRPRKRPSTRYGAFARSIRRWWR